MSFGLLSLAFGAALLWKKGTVTTHDGYGVFTKGGKLAADSLNRLPELGGPRKADAQAYFDDDVPVPMPPPRKQHRAAASSSGVTAATNALNAFVKKHGASGPTPRVFQSRQLANRLVS